MRRVAVATVLSSGSGARASLGEVDAASSGRTAPAVLSPCARRCLSPLPPPPRKHHERSTRSACARARVPKRIEPPEKTGLENLIEDPNRPVDFIGAPLQTDFLTLSRENS